MFSKQKSLPLIAILLFIIWMTTSIAIPKDSIIFLDVGQGDAILIQDGTNQILIDGGPSADLLTQLAEHLPWFDRTIEVVAPPYTTQNRSRLSC